MALNIKDSETEALAAALAQRLHTSKTAAVRNALHAQLAAFDTTQADQASRVDGLLNVLRAEIWPVTAAAGPITKHEREQLLGYTADGV